MRRWTRSVTGVLFEEAAEGVGAIFRRFVHELQKPLRETFGKILYLLEDA